MDFLSKLLLQMSEPNLQNLSFVMVQNLLLQPTIAHGLQAHKTQDLDQWMFLSYAVFNIIVNLFNKIHKQLFKELLKCPSDLERKIWFAWISKIERKRSSCSPG